MKKACGVVKSEYRFCCRSQGTRPVGRTSQPAAAGSGAPHARYQRGRACVQGWAGPAQNWILADAAGHIAWTVNGPIPRRIGFDGSQPESWADGTRYWQGEVERPTAGDGREALYTANNRILPPEKARAYSRVWWLPLRAKRIEELLAAPDVYRG